MSNALLLEKALKQARGQRLRLSLPSRAEASGNIPDRGVPKVSRQMSQPRKPWARDCAPALLQPSILTYTVAYTDLGRDVNVMTCS